MAYRNGGSFYDEWQLRYKGKFVKERIRMTLQDRLFLEKNGFSIDEAKQAVQLLNLELEKRIRAGESEQEVMAQMGEFYEPRK